MESRESVRLRMKTLRDSMAREEQRALSLEVCRRLLESTLLDHLTSIALYASVRNEVATEEIFNQLRLRGCRMLWPRVSNDRIEFVESREREAFVPGRWGIPEPPSGEVVDLKVIEAVLVPGVAFDEVGGRLGFGKGYYDRALNLYEGRKIGLAYDFQVLPIVPRGVADIVCDWVVTEKRVIRGAAREESTWNLRR